MSEFKYPTKADCKSLLKSLNTSSPDLMHLEEALIGYKFKDTIGMFGHSSNIISVSYGHDLAECDTIGFTGVDGEETYFLYKEDLKKLFTTQGK